jgi:predicted transcriptional regulator
MRDLVEEKKKKILEVDIRRDIYDLVRKNAGSHFREIERKSGLTVGTVSYHLNFLKKHNLITEEKEGKNVRYFPKEFKAKNKKLMTFLRQKSTRNILLQILINKKCSHDDITKNISLSPSTVSWHVKKLLENNLITTQKIDRRTRYGIAIDEKEVMNLLITYKKTFLDAMVDNVVEMWEMD